MRPRHGQQRIWLDVPYEHKDDANAHGARWDPAVRRWYAPRPGMPGLDRWQPLPHLLPGEDRGFGYGLFVDLIPEGSWLQNVRTAVDPADWHRLRTMACDRAGHRCEACGATGDRAAGLRLEAHERFAYDDTTHVQALRRLICLCIACHLVTHYGFAAATGRRETAETHLQAVTGMTPRQAAEHIQEAFRTWERRSLYDWTVDLTIITSAGITVRLPRPAPLLPRFPGPPATDGWSATISPVY